jgi:hypothetical protein
MEDFENVLALLLYLIFIGAIFLGGFYAGFRYRDNLSLERQKKYRSSPQRGTSRVPESPAGSAEFAE